MFDEIEYADIPKFASTVHMRILIICSMMNAIPYRYLWNDDETIMYQNIDASSMSKACTVVTQSNVVGVMSYDNRNERSSKYTYFLDATLGFRNNSTIRMEVLDNFSSTDTVLNESEDTVMNYMLLGKTKEEFFAESIFVEGVLFRNKFSTDFMFHGLAKLIIDTEIYNSVLKLFVTSIDKENYEKFIVNVIQYQSFYRGIAEGIPEWQ